MAGVDAGDDLTAFTDIEVEEVIAIERRKINDVASHDIIIIQQVLDEILSKIAAMLVTVSEDVSGGVIVSMKPKAGIQNLLMPRTFDHSKEACVDADGAGQASSSLVKGKRKEVTKDVDLYESKRAYSTDKHPFSIPLSKNTAAAMEALARSRFAVIPGVDSLEIKDSSIPVEKLATRQSSDNDPGDKNTVCSAKVHATCTVNAPMAVTIHVALPLKPPIDENADLATSNSTISSSKVSEVESKEEHRDNSQVVAYERAVPTTNQPQDDESKLYQKALSKKPLSERKARPAAAVPQPPSLSVPKYPAPSSSFGRVPYHRHADYSVDNTGTSSHYRDRHGQFTANTLFHAPPSLNIPTAHLQPPSLSIPYRRSAPNVCMYPPATLPSQRGYVSLSAAADNRFNGSVRYARGEERMRR
jgi:hypothetical protein